jgi:hypothetical protein
MKKTKQKKEEKKNIRKSQALTSGQPHSRSTTGALKHDSTGLTEQ